MKKVILIILFSRILFSCSEKDESTNTDLIGKWKLTEILADPGDGSGTFHSVSSNVILEFHSDYTVTSNKPVCTMSIETGEPGSGTYSLADSTISSGDCGTTYSKLKFEISGSVLILYYPCIEPCATKYVKQ